MRALASCIVPLILAAVSAPAHAVVVKLDFEGLNSSANESPLNYYNGGAGSAGTTGGPNYGVSFSSNTITGCTQPNSCANTNSAGNPSGSNIIFFTSGGSSIMNVLGGFDTGFSFLYSAANNPGTVTVWSGADRTGSLLATLTLPVTGNGSAVPGCVGTNFCPYFAAGVAFAGTAMSVDFAGTNNQIGFDDITLGASSPISAAPEPATWGLMLFGFGLVGRALRKRRAASGTGAAAPKTAVTA